MAMKPVADVGTGKLAVAWGAGNNRRFLGEEFFDKECDEDQREKLLAYMEHVAEHGHMRNEKAYKFPLKHQGNIGEFKVFKKRLFFFREQNTLIITHGAGKKRDETDQADIDKVKRIKREMGYG